MSRDLTAGMASAVAANVVRPVLFYEGVFVSGTLRLWSGIGPIDWNGQTWTGAGQLLSVGSVAESSELRAVGFSVSLAGEASSILSLSLAQARQGLAGRVWLGTFDSIGVLNVDPFKSFDARLDVPEIVDEGATATITMNYESRLIDLDRMRERRYTSEDQQSDYPGDLGFDFVPGMQDQQIAWGRPPSGPVQQPMPPADTTTNQPG